MNKLSAKDQKVFHKIEGDNAIQHFYAASHYILINEIRTRRLDEGIIR